MTPVDAVSDLFDAVEPLPDSALHLLHVVGHAQSTTDDLLAALRQQPSVMAEVIRLSNSSLHDLRSEITDVSQTVAYLGANTLSRMVATLCMSPYYRRHGDLSRNTATAWHHGVATGIAAQIIAERKGTTNPGCAFAAGLLHDIGELPMMPSVEAESSSLMRAALACRHGFVEAERLILGIDHSAAGALLGERWRLPSELRSVIRHHHDPESRTHKDELTSIVHVADVLTRQLGIGVGTGGLSYPVSEDEIQRLHLDTAELDAIRLLVMREIPRSEDLLKLGAGGGR